MTTPKKRERVLPILAIDLGTFTGWALRDMWGEVTSGRVSFELSRWESHGMRLLRFRKWVREILDEHLLAGDPDEAVVVYERPIIAGRGKKQARSGNEVGKMLAGALLPELEERGLHNAAPTPAQVKKVACGKGNANKEALANAAAKLWEHYKVPEDFDPKRGDDEADALCVLHWGVVELKNSGPPGYNP